MLTLDDSRTTRRLRLAPICAADADDLAAITTGEISSLIDFLPHPFTRADALALVRHPGDVECFHALRTLEGGALVGVVGTHLHDDGREVEIGYWLAAEARGQGLATEAAAAIIGDLIRRSPGVRIVAECRPGNRRSLALLERLGFESTRRDGRRPGRIRLLWTGRPNYRCDVC